MHNEITVIALCYNHARFVETCLESIRAQTTQNFQLIVTDDCSKDNSPQLIEAWLAKYYPSAVFIRHQRNAGLCPTLNEALSHATGRYISMIATDDTWEPEKLERQLAAMEKCPSDVAVMYSDAYQMDESGQRLPLSFMEAHGIVGEPPHGQVFSRMADGNFIPAMATLIRRDALVNVGGYDENLTYEDFDMWLRLADKYRFEFLAEKLANYRLVSTSMVRTIFDQPTPAHAYSIFSIAEKWLITDRLTDVQRKRWVDRLSEAAYLLYCHDDRRSAHCLWKAYQCGASIRYGLLSVSKFAGLSRSNLKRMASIFGHKE